jgi:selenocysteine-specific elongation factor
VKLGELPIRLGVPPSMVASVVAPIGGWCVGERFIGPAARKGLVSEALATLEAYHADHPLEPGAPLQWLRSRLRAPDDVGAALLAMMAAEGAIVVEQGMARRPDFVPRLTAEQTGLRDALLDALAAAGQEPPTLEELAPLLGASLSDLLPVSRLLAREGYVIAVEAGRYYQAATVETLLARLRAGMAPGDEYGPAELRDLLGFSRKFLIPFLEFCDRTGHTVRDGGGRRRRGGI